MLSDQLRIKQGPLARVWLASHWERKISKSQFLQTNLEKTIDAIKTNQEEEPIALRVSGQLLLGVVRIFSRKTKYLLEDCNEALVKIKLAFKKGDVNMPDIHHTIANVNTITLQNKLTEFDILLPDLPFNINGGTALDERDPILDSFVDMSQDITLNDFSFGNYETGRGLGGVEVGRRDNEPGFADTAFDMDAIADPMKEMNLNDNGLFNDTIDFDFDVADQDLEAPNAAAIEQFNLPNEDDTLMQAGIVEDTQLFDMDVEQPVVRRRKRLVVDKVTEIPQEDLRRYANDTSTIVTKETGFDMAKGTKEVVKLTAPLGSLGHELETMFEQFNRKRRASQALGQIEKEPRIMEEEGADLQRAFQFDDGGDFDAGEFNQDAMAAHFNTVNNNDSIQSLLFIIITITHFYI
ncbi:Rec8 like protein-domain-containing protein [Cokeromyces recurvatus]|uniref:Rec8 like protein-domain-containing protein n=1 Tax=Cokeromyces recurvatus TaxID=90255 RepID=UPI002220D50F|nr:Rec8 like protein-domain-containing protein [Cokeromyces recurvatus]KAI7898061.1 Rec8 like protein-domain-containing protein [Cokeromyces recurvatus]